MALPKQIIVKETLSELKDLQRKSGHLIAKRLRILIEFKKHEETGISKRAVSENTGINHNSITKWRNVYLGFTQTNKMFVNKGLQSKKPEIDARPLRKPFKNPCR